MCFSQLLYHNIVHLIGAETGILLEDSYCQTSNISHTFVGNIIIDHSDVVGASPVGAAPTTAPFST